MKLGHFVSGSSLVLAGWLAVTFVYRVPVQRYVKPEKAPAAEAAKESVKRDPVREVGVLRGRRAAGMVSFSH